MLSVDVSFGGQVHFLELSVALDVPRSLTPESTGELFDLHVSVSLSFWTSQASRGKPSALATSAPLWRRQRG